MYLDYAAFAPVDPRVLAVMRPFLEGGVGNPSATHSLGVEARESLESARAKVGRLVGGAPAGVIFTGSATEATNLAIRGVVLRAGGAGRHVITTAIEHVSVLNVCRDLEKAGVATTLLPVDGEGRVDPADLERALRPGTALVSVAAANGEIGTLQPLAELARITRGAGVPLHVDAVGALGRVPLGAEALGIDLLSLSGNDLYGPPGVGALWVRPGVRIAPLTVGAGQEGGYRAGTENLPSVVGLGVAAELMRSEAGHGELAQIAGLRDALHDGILRDVPDCRLTGARRDRLPQHLSVVVRDVKAERVLMDLDLAGVAAASGAACMARTGAPSHVLRAIGCDAAELPGPLCFTLGRWTTAADVAVVVERLPDVVGRLRALAGTG